MPCANASPADHWGSSLIFWIPGTKWSEVLINCCHSKPAPSPKCPIKSLAYKIPQYDRDHSEILLISKNHFLWWPESHHYNFPSLSYRIYFSSGGHHLFRSDVIKLYNPFQHVNLFAGLLLADSQRSMAASRSSLDVVCTFNFFQ